MKAAGRKYFIIAIIALLTLSIVLAGCKPKQEEKAAEVKTPVKLSVVGTGSVERDITFTGTMVSRNKVDLFSKIPGRVASVLTDEGHFVKAGDVVVQLEDREIRAQLNQARAALRVAQAQASQAETGHELTSSTTGIQVNVVSKSIDQAEEMVDQAQSSYNNARLDYNRMKDLYAKGAVAKQTLDQTSTQYEIARSRLEAAQAQVKQAKENLRLAQAGTRQSEVSRSQVTTAYAGVDAARANVEYLEVMLDNTQIRSPINGVVTARNVEPGELVSPGDKDPPIAVTDNSIVYLEADIPESDVSGLNKGEEVNVTFDALKKTMKGNVQTIIASANPRSRTFRIKVSIPNPEDLIKDGMTGTGTARVAVYSGIVIPRPWLKVIEGEYYVVTIDENMRAVNHKVKLGYYTEKKALVKEGLKAGDKVVSAGQETLKDGDLVEIKDDAAIDSPSPAATIEKI